MDNYAGPFQADFHLGRLSRAALAVLAREYMMAGHMLDRAGIGQIATAGVSVDMWDVAIDEWMGASPIYTRRMQRALNFAGDDVATIFKGIQFDIGSPHTYLDFQFKVRDAHYGEFWLPSCGALRDVEPMGEDFVRGMCHKVEDPTFDATALATNPRARIRPIHRPPRVPADRVPVCHWTTTIDPNAEPVTEIEQTRRVRQSRIAALDIKPLGTGESGGWADYSGPFDNDFDLEEFSHAALTVVCQELCVQAHLLVRSFMMALAARSDDATARRVAAKQWIGVGGLSTERLVAALGIGGHDLAAIAKVLQLHSVFQPRAYLDFRVELAGDRVSCWLNDCEALREGDAYSWFALPREDALRALASIVRPINPQAQCRLAERAGARLAFEIVIDPSAPPAPEPAPVQLTKLSSGATHVFRRRRPVGA